MRLAISHTTHYDFSRPVAHGLQRLRLKPKTSHGQRVLEWTMTLDGARAQADYDDHHHNQTTLVSVDPGARAVTVTCGGIVETADTAGVIGAHTGHMPLWRFLAQTELTRPGPKLRALAADAQAEGGHRLDELHRLSEIVREAVRYEVGHTDVATRAEDALEAGHGVCQDHAHVFIGAARQLGIPARYVSGYLMVNDRVDQEAGHAWAEAHVEGLGWVGFDVSNGICPDARYVRVATGFDYSAAAPVTGISFGAGETGLRVALAVAQQSVGQ